MNVTNPRMNSVFVRASACCRIVPNVPFFYSSTAQVAEMSAFIIYVVHVMRDALKEGLLNLKKGGVGYFSESVDIILTYINEKKRRITWISTKG